jgi:hypothetical protein
MTRLSNISRLGAYATTNESSDIAFRVNFNCLGGGDRLPSPSTNLPRSYLRLLYTAFSTRHSENDNNVCFLLSRHLDVDLSKLSFVIPRSCAAKTGCNRGVMNAIIPNRAVSESSIQVNGTAMQGLICEGFPFTSSVCEHTPRDISVNMTTTPT